MTAPARFGLGLAALAIICSMPTHAQSSKVSKGDTVADIIKSIDRNGNGCVDTEEGRNYSSRRFHAMDANADGILDASEAPLGPGEDTSSRPISLNDWADAYPLRFAALDMDGNGCVTDQEIRANMPAGSNGGQ